MMKLFLLQEEYSLKENNCEHLISIATIGTPFSIQVEKVILLALQCSKGVVRSCRGTFMGHASNCCVSNCCPIASDVTVHAIAHTPTIGMSCCPSDVTVYAVAHTPTIGMSSCPSDVAMHAVAHTPTMLQTGMSNSTHQLGHIVASKAPTLATEAGANLTTKSAAKASLKTTSKAAFEVGSEAAISGTVLGAIGGIAFGVNVLLETPFYIRGAYKLGRKKKFDVISKEEYQREMIKITFKSVNTVVGGTLGAVAGQAAIPVPVLGAVVGGFVGGVLGQACGYLEGKAVGYVIRDPTKVTLPMLNTPAYLKVEELENQLKKKSESLCPHTSEDDDTTQVKWHV
jgi:hypothetical protein